MSAWYTRWGLVNGGYYLDVASVSRIVRNFIDNHKLDYNIAKRRDYLTSPYVCKNMFISIYLIRENYIIFIRDYK